MHHDTSLDRPMRCAVLVHSIGPMDDIERATQLAKRMVTEFGMSDKLGSLRYAGQRMQYMAARSKRTAARAA